MDFLTIIYSIMFFFGIYFLLLFILIFFRNSEKLYDYPLPEKNYSISVVVPCYNEEKTIGDTIQNLVNLNYSGFKKIIVVDDCSTDKSFEVAKSFEKKFPDKIRVVQTPKNTGNAAGAKNYGAKFVEAELIGFSDADSYPTSDSLSKMVGYFNDKKVAAVTSKVWAKNNERRFIEKFQDVDYTVIAWSRKVLDFIGCVYVTNGPLSVYKTDLFKNVGGFDENNLTEDIEITWNFLSRGYKTKMSYSAIVHTFVPDNFNEWNKQRIRWNVGGLQTLAKYRSFFLKGKNLFGYFVISYVGLSFFLALIGFLLFLRFLYHKLSPYIFSFPFVFKGYNPFKFTEFYFSLTLLAILGFSFLIFSMIYHKIALRNSQVKKTHLMKILIYTFIYRPLYTIPLIMSLYKILRRDFTWYTK